MIKRFFILWTLFLSIIAVTSCSGDEENVIDDGSANTSDVAVTGLIEECGVTYATISGYVNLQLLTSVGSNPSIGVELGEVKITEDGESLQNIKTKTTTELVGKQFMVDVSGLKVGCKYKYRSFVKAGGITYYGGYRNFSTKEFINLTTTGDVSDITFTSACITSGIDKESINSKETYSIGVAYSTVSSKLHPDSTFNAISFPINELKDETYTISLNRLLTETTYHYASYTKAGDTYRFGEIKSFLTKSLQGHLTTGDASDVTFSTATIKGTSSVASLYSSGTYITYGVRFGVSKDALNYTVTANITEESANNLTAKINGLSANQTYYYCVYARVDGTELTGKVKSFTTKATDGYLTIDDAADVTFASATLKGKTLLSDLYKNSTSTIRYEFRYATDRNSLDGYNYKKTAPALTGDSLTATLRDLTESTTYYYRLNANVDGTTLQTAIKQFTTKPFSEFLVTGEATNVTLTSATVTGTARISEVYPDATSIDYFVFYATSESYLSNSSYRKSVKATLDKRELSALLTDLHPNTTYYYKVAAYVDGKYLYGDVKNLTTKTGSDYNSYLFTGAATNVTLTSAEITGTSTLADIYPHEFSIQYDVYYGTSSDNLSKSVSMTSNNGKLCASLANLSINTTYYYCVEAIVAGAVVKGEIKTFTTKTGTDYLSTGSASNITLTSADISGTSTLSEAYSNGSSIQYKMYYGTSSGNLSKEKSMNSDNGKLSASLSNLSMNTTYYYCVGAIVDGMIIQGNVKSFRTKSENDLASYLSTGSASNITLTSADISGTSTLSMIYPNSSSIQYKVYYGTSNNSLSKSTVMTLTNGKLNASLSNLSINTTYYYCVGAIVDGVTIKGDVKSFITKSGNDLASYLSTGSASNITLTSADISGTSTLSEVYPNAASIQYKINYGTSSNNLLKEKAMNSNNGKLSITITDLTMGTTYYYCVAATFGGVTIKGGVKSFTTKQASDYLSTGTATNITLISANISGTSTLAEIYPNENLFQYKVYYGTSSDNLSKSVSMTSNNGKLSASLANLSINTTYYYCVGAIVAGAVVKGEIKTFTTKTGTDYLSTGSASNITLTSADISGTSTLSEVYPNAASIQYKIYYGTSSNKLLKEKAMNSNNGKLSITITDLTMGTTYYYCVAATFGGVTIKGGVKSFTTKQASDYFSNGEAKNIGTTHAEIVGTSTLYQIYPNDNSIKYELYYGTSNNNLTKSLTMNSVNDQLSVTLYNLAMGTTYYYCITSNINNITLKGNVQSFTTIYEPDYIDLGLSCKWASFNLGATKPEEVGNYYAWGEFDPKTTFTPSNYIGKNRLDNCISATEYDTARKTLGSLWRMPTISEFQELIEKCNWQEATYKNTEGYLVTGKNGKSIFLPKAGCKYENRKDGGYAYWTANSDKPKSSYAYIWSGIGANVIRDIYRYYGCPIRPVQ